MFLVFVAIQLCFFIHSINNNILLIFFTQITLDSFSLLSPCLIVGALLLAPLGWRIAAANHHTKVALVEGWTPVILAMTISR